METMQSLTMRCHIATDPVQHKADDGTMVIFNVAITQPYISKSVEDKDARFMRMVVVNRQANYIASRSGKGDLVLVMNAQIAFDKKDNRPYLLVGINSSISLEKEKHVD